MNTPDKKTTDKKPKVTKPQGPIRTEAIIPFLIVVLLIGGYFKFLFDHNLKTLIEWGGYFAVGAEVNVGSVNTSFLKGTFQINNIQVTDAEKPNFNSFEISDIRFAILWDGLLRARIIIDEMAAEGIKIQSPRKRPGRVRPPDPVKPQDSGGSVIGEKAQELKDKALDKVEESQSENILGDLASLLGGTSSSDQMGKIEGNLASKAKIKEFEKAFKEKQQNWNAKIKTLPQGKEIQSIGDRLSKVKVKDFKSKEELEASLKEIDTILKDADAKVKTISAANSELNSDLKTLDQQYKEIDEMVKNDIKALESRFKIPKLDAASLSKALFAQYTGPYLAKANRYKSMAEKYIPPNLMKKDKKAPEDEIKPHPRAKGVSYEFGRPNSYPMFWIKRILINSKATPEGLGNLDGKITNITSNQKLINQPTVITFNGDFPSSQLSGLKSLISIDTRPEDSLIDFAFDVGQYPISDKDLVASDEVSVAFAKASAGFVSKGSLTGLTRFKYQMENKFSNVQYNVKAKNQTVSTVLTDIFKDIPTVTVDVSASGNLPLPNLSLSSNLGSELQRGLEKQLQKKIDEARKKLDEFVNAQIGAERKKIEDEFNKFKSQYQGEISKIQNQINGEKSKAESKVNTAKKEAENDAKKKLEAEAKKALGDDAQKKMDELKKKFKF